ncbi:MAG: T9SS type A sorting domain-containing protein [Bacteroidia bacterium]|nr:T9SS type A sorting domain-containing protein [Bacteroidia bacterium]MCZ2276697.1 T9SS type A sorting domain-containing protein [Bacteroidia bacterium]
MIKKLPLQITTILLVVTQLSYGQTSGGPDAYGYTWRNSSDPNGPVFSWIDLNQLSGVITVTGLADDNLRGPFVMPFTFQYYWYQPSKFWIGSNGHIGFTNASVAHPFPAIPLPTGINDYLGVMVTDLTHTDVNSQPISTASCKYWINPANDTLIVTWENVPFWAPGSPGYSGSNTFQAILTSTDSSITYQYLNQSGSSASTVSFVTTGIENNSGNIGLQVLYNIYPTGGTAVKFYAPATTSLQINDASTLYCNNLTTGGLFLSANGNAYESMAEIANSGNQSLASFNVYSRILSSANTIQVRDTVPVSNLSPGQTQVVTFPDLWTPTNAGVYRHITETLLPGDATPSNNQRMLELQVIDTTQASMQLSFDTGLDAGLGGLSWNGGSGGAAMHFVPPFTPCILTKATFYIVANNLGNGFHALVFDDLGPNGEPQNLLDSVFVQGASVIPGAWNEVTFSQPLLISSGGFYVVWMMGGEEISIGQNQIPPISNRTFEVLGSASIFTNWADYRYREIEEVMINVFIEKVLGVNEGGSLVSFASVYPNPVTDLANVVYRVSEKSLVSYRLYSFNGQLVEERTLGYSNGNGMFSINVSTLDSGIYLCSISIGKNLINKKITVTR